MNNFKQFVKKKQFLGMAGWTIYAPRGSGLDIWIC